MSRITERNLYVALGLVVFTACLAQTAYGAATEPRGLDAISSFDRLPYLKYDTVAGGFSSYQRDGGNKDGKDSWLYEESGDNVLCELKGPGVIYRTWFTGYDPFGADFEVYIDGEITPRIDQGSVFDLQTGSFLPFLRPLIRDWVESSGGHPSYMPIQFNESIKITSDVLPDPGDGEENLFYNINYHLFSPDTTVTSYTGAEDASAANALWDSSQMTSDPKSTAGNTVVSDTVSVAAGGTATLLDIDGPASIASIKLDLGSLPSETVLNNTWLRIYWDGESTPDVDAPLGMFFAIGRFGVGIRPQALPIGLADDDTLYCYFPMPFDSHATVELYNGGGTALSSVSYEIQHAAFTGDIGDVGYFKTQYNVEEPSTSGDDLVLLDVEGAGHMVGVVQCVSGPGDRTYLEGDERIYVDGRHTPSIHGTGTEDFYNGGWYFNGGLVTWPAWGYTQHVSGTPDKSSMYRFFLQDAIPFNSEILAGIEHGGANEKEVDAWMLAYYYHQPARMLLTDTLDVGGSASETAHSYSVTGTTTLVSLTDTFEGDADDVSVTEDGRTVDGTSSFTLAIDSGNEGVVLRRMFDQDVFNQEAELYVDSQYVGPMYTAGGNTVHRWKEADFMIPTSFTAGKSSIAIDVVFVSAMDPGDVWNEYRYAAFSKMPAAPMPEAEIAITTNGGVDFSTFTTPVSIEGTANALTDSIELNGTPIAYTPGAATWSVDVPLSQGANVLSFAGVDGDAVPAAAEVITVTYDPDLDTDGDGLPDWWESENGTEIETPDATADPDGDHLTNEEEYGRGTSPQDPDSDGDGVPDGVEVSAGTDPMSADDTPQLPVSVIALVFVLALLTILGLRAMAATPRRLR